MDWPGYIPPGPSSTLWPLHQTRLIVSIGLDHNRPMIQKALSKLGTALLKGRYLICLKLLTIAPMGWSGSHYWFEIWRGPSIKISAILLDCKIFGANWFVTGGCGARGCIANGCAATGGDVNCFVVAAIGWSSILIICLANMFVCTATSLNNRMKSLSLPSLFSIVWIA